MSSSNEPATGSLSVDDLKAMDDAALAALMERHRQPDGAIHLPVRDWDELSDGALEKLGQRLKELQADKTPVLNLDQLDAHLRDIRDQSETVEREHRSCSRSTIMPDYEETMRFIREREIEAYNNLVEDGGRPAYPLELLDEVTRAVEKSVESTGSPEEYSDLIKPWDAPYRPFRSFFSDFEIWDVFQKQWARWQDFRVWQRDNRCIGDWDSNPPRPDTVISLMAWARRSHVRNLIREVPRNEAGEAGFPSYADAVKRRLARHGFTRPFQLKEDANQQDELTTWIEYLNYEYFLLDLCTTRNRVYVKRQHDCLAWVLDQLPLIEAELSQKEALVSEPEGIERSRRSKRKLDSNDHDPQQRAPKRPKASHSEKSSTIPAPRILRRSARIAALAESQKTPVPQSSRTKSRPRQAKPAKVQKLESTSKTTKPAESPQKTPLPQPSRTKPRPRQAKPTPVQQPAPSTKTTKVAAAGRKNIKTDNARKSAEPQGVTKRGLRRR